MTTTILELLEENQFIEMETEEDSIVIWFKKFFRNKREFHFELNGLPIDGCKTKKTAIKKIEGFINQGFELSN